MIVLSAFLPADLRLLAWAFFDVFWILAMLALGFRRRDYPIGIVPTLSMAERFDDFTIIVLSEVVAGVVAGPEDPRRDETAIVAAATGFSRSHYCACRICRWSALPSDRGWAVSLTTWCTTGAISLAVLGLGACLNSSPILFAGTILFAHVGMDRLAGYGLKHVTNFKDTHLREPEERPHALIVWPPTTLHRMPAAELLFVQGAGDMLDPDGSGHLAKYIQTELGDDVSVTAPEMPDASSDPRYLPWRNKIEADLRAMEGPVIVVGHSVGGSVVLKYLAEGPPLSQIVGLFMVSVPWWGPDGWDWEEFAVREDFESKLPDCPIFMFHSVDDPEVPFAHLRIYQKRLPRAVARQVPGAEHSFVDGLPVLVDDIRGLLHSPAM